MPPHEEPPGRAPVAAADVTLAVRLAAAALGRAPAEAWGNQAGSLEWDCWETVEHIADDLFAYATQLTPATPEGGYVPIAMTSTRPGGAESAIHVDREKGTASLLQALEACGALLVAMLTTTSPDTRAWHPHGTSDPEGFAAMGVAETLIHGQDAAQGLGVPWEPPADLCARVLSRLFPGAPADAPPWTVLLWASGRADLPDRPRLVEWRWYSEPRP
ncbi:MAG: maleylpyruvate isomerase N-terminal domain-containing protein [Streptosporangiaceae bacterium]